MTGGLEEFLSAPMPADEAEALIAGIGEAVDGIWPDLIALYKGRAWLSLGYGSWSELCDERMRFRPSLAIEERREVVRELTGAGLSTRAIGTAVGVSHQTIANDQEAASTVKPLTVESLDGKQRTRPDPIQVVTDAINHDPDVARANLRRDFLKAIHAIDKVRDFDPVRMAEVFPDTGDGFIYSMERLNQWFDAYKTASKPGLRVITGGEK